MSLASGSSTAAKFEKHQVIDLILKMKNLNNKEYAAMVYRRENELHPEWELRGAFLAMKKDEASHG